MSDSALPEGTKKLVLASDLFLDLKLYRIPTWILDELQKAFPFLEIVEVNTPRTQGNPLPQQAKVYWGNRITPSIISGLPHLQWIHFGSVGVDRAVVPDVMSRKILVTNSGGIVTASVAASALGFMTALARGFHYCWAQRCSGIFGRQEVDHYFENIGDLEGQSCLIVGYGDVGRRVGKVCQALGMHVSAIRRRNATPTRVVERFYDLKQLPEAVKGKDFVINLVPFTSKTRRVFDGRVFQQMDRTAYFINVGRGETVDEDALIAVLKDRRIAGAGLDVFGREPLALDSPLFQCDNVILTPHIATLSRHYWPRAFELIKANIERFISGRPLLNVRNVRREY